MAVSIAHRGKEVIVSIRAFPKFDELPIDMASQIIYSQVVPACEEKKVRLSNRGNQTSLLTEGAVEIYNQKTHTDTLFNVERIQAAFAILDDLFLPTVDFNTDSDSSDFRKDVERLQRESITNGDLIVALMLKGYSARFGTTKESVNAHFQLTCLKKQVTHD